MTRAKSTVRNGRMYKARRAALIERLGGKCQITLEELTKLSARRQKCKGPLQIDHVDGITWEARKMSSHTRIKRYAEELTAGVRLRLLCTRHNRQDGWRRSRG